VNKPTGFPVIIEKVEVLCECGVFDRDVEEGTFDK
jgi:hypothetical protein